MCGVAYLDEEGQVRAPQQVPAIRYQNTDRQRGIVNYDVEKCPNFCICPQYRSDLLLDLIHNFVWASPLHEAVQRQKVKPKENRRPSKLLQKDAYCG